MGLAHKSDFRKGKGLSSFLPYNFPSCWLRPDISWWNYSLNWRLDWLMKCKYLWVRDNLEYNKSYLMWMKDWETREGTEKDSNTSEEQLHSLSLSNINISLPPINELFKSPKCYERKWASAHSFNRFRSYTSKELNVFVHSHLFMVADGLSYHLTQGITFQQEIRIWKSTLPMKTSPSRGASVIYLDW